MGLVGYDWAPLGVDLATHEASGLSTAPDRSQAITSGSRERRWVARVPGHGQGAAVHAGARAARRRDHVAARESQATGRANRSAVDVQMARRRLKPQCRGATDMHTTSDQTTDSMTHNQTR